LLFKTSRGMTQPNSAEKSRKLDYKVGDNFQDYEKYFKSITFHLCDCTIFRPMGGGTRK
jgi:hypothetical protein